MVKKRGKNAAYKLREKHSRADLKRIESHDQQNGYETGAIAQTSEESTYSATKETNTIVATRPTGMLNVVLYLL